MTELVVDEVERGQLLQLAGRLDVHAAADVRLVLADAVETGTGDLVIDLAALEALDATGLGVLVGAHRRADRAGRTLVLRDMTAPVRRVLSVTRLDRVLHTRTTDAA
ncbi:MAG: STAS domain-containing protein [Actinobacteria bacterium]|nr:STAS domain-containing protein [Actinomycetota bacterium]MCA1721688.1 STAS domain-containing protein [Actinomycetota bacterium]